MGEWINKRWYAVQSWSCKRWLGVSALELWLDAIIPLQLLHLEDVASIQKIERLRSLASLSHFNNFFLFGTLSTPVIRSDFPSSTSAFSNGAEINPLDVLESQWQHYTAGYVIWFVVEKPHRSSKPEWIIMRLHKKGPSRHILLIRTYQTPSGYHNLQPCSYNQNDQQWNRLYDVTSILAIHEL